AAGSDLVNTTNADSAAALNCGAPGTVFPFPYINEERSMAFKVKRRGKITYYYEGDDPVLSNLVVEEQPDGDQKLYFAGLTGGYSAKNVLGLDTLVTMDPDKEIPLVFECWEKWVREAGICD